MRDLFDPPTGVAESHTARWEGRAASPLEERAFAHGLETLNERETLALYLERSCPRGAEALASVLLARFGDLQHVLAASLSDLQQVVGRASALDLKLLHDMTRRVLAFPFARRCVLSSWSAVLSYLRLVLAAEPREVFRVLFLDKKNQLIADEILGVGTIDHAPVYPREVVRRALELNASAMILAHQHPSGDPTPSAADVEITREVVAAAKALRISVHDHVVVGGDSTVSFRALGHI